MQVELALKDGQIVVPVQNARESEYFADLVAEVRYLTAPGNRAERRARCSKRFKRSGAMLFNEIVGGIERRYHATKGWRRTRVAAA